MINAGFTTGALRISTGSYDAWDYEFHSETEEIQSSFDDKNCWDRKNPGYGEGHSYYQKTFDYINPNSITAIKEIKSNPKDKDHRPVNKTIIHTADGESHTTFLSRDEIIDCANKALATGKVIDLIA